MPTLDDCKKICNDFAEARRPDTGKLTCQNLISGEMCRLPGHFVCEIKLWSNKPRAHFSHSQANLLQFCERAWALEKLWGARVSGLPAKWKIVGSAFALCRAKIDAGQPYDVSALIPEGPDRAKLEAVLEVYKTMPRLSYDSEGQVSYPLGSSGLFLLGYYDGLSQNKKTVYEWKYAVSPDGYTKLTVAAQACAYFAGIPEAEEVMICVAKKPQQRQKKGKPAVVPEPGSRKKARDAIPDETLEEFKNRIIGTLKESASAFTYQTFLRSEFNVKGEVARIRRLGERSLGLRREYDTLLQQGVPRKTAARLFLPSYANCNSCDWMPYCHDHVEGIGCEDAACKHPTTCAAVLGKPPPAAPTTDVDWLQPEPENPSDSSDMEP